MSRWTIGPPIQRIEAAIIESPRRLHGALVPLVAGPLALGNAFLAGFEVSRSAWTIFPAGVALAMLAYYLMWKYLVGFLNGVLDVD